MADDFAGVETWYADGSGQIAVTDRLTRFVARGQLSVPAVYPPGSGVRTVVIPGIKNDGTWFVNATGSCIVEIYDGYFRYERIDFWEWDDTNPWEKEGPDVFYTVMQL
ncbi:hypothetical protein HOT57_gp92 [Pseudomonas phage phCDa]|uniref:Uncharacterized protein n=1 Tax=Pseudomonas phage phCDa TaxID=2268587 RepID=A0A2Z5HA22_9CAUD|nr:hypothetical protein HOT57_gp92 [Pseudomonas phage phCDa]AXC36536.1 hypothetical protein phCDa_92 [Pseudomonas phage phCDa]